MTLTAVVPSTENMPSGHAVKPGDIVTAMNGKTIEVNNTDAEGRLILADALCYAVEQGAERIVDLATLTGAILVALGHTYAGLYANDDDWYADVAGAGDATGEICWRMPLHPEYLELTKGKFADLTNAVRGAGGRAPTTPPSSCASSWATCPGRTWTWPARPGECPAPTWARAPRGSARGS